MADTYAYDRANRTGWSTGSKVAVGCGLVTFVLLILVCGGVFWGVNWLKNRVQAFVEKHEAAGFTIVDTDQLHVVSPITTPTAYVGGEFTIDADSSADIAFLCQSARISSHIQGNIEAFNGQMLTLQSGAEIDGDINLGLIQLLEIQSGAIVHGNIHATTGQIITINNGAVVEGTITGTWQSINKQAGAIVGQGAKQNPDEPEEPDQ
jgi:cytoskeletal protein CcmA (bactofilin family)